MTRTAEQRRALVVGGSMSGLFAGLLLRQQGFSVDVYERVESELSGRGAGIVAQPVVARTLTSLGLGAADLGVDMTTRKILDSSGALVCEFECPQTLTAWERLYRILRDGFPAAHYHRGIGLKRFEQDSRAVVAHFSDGSSAEADVLIGADGIRSTVRAAIAAAACPALCRLCGVACAVRRTARFRPRFIANCSES